MLLRTVFLLILFTSTVSAQDIELPFNVTPVATFNEPWAMTFMPDGRMLVTEKRGRLYIVDQDGEKSRPVEDVPNVDYRGQGGLGDVILHPNFAKNGLVYLSYAESGIGNVRGAAVARGKLVMIGNAPTLTNVEVIWRQNPKMTDDGHYGHRMVFSDDGYLFITSGDRQKFDPAQYMTGNVGKIVRINDDGSIPEDNPFFDDGDVAAEIWTLGHRNPLGIAFDDNGQLWSTEMGPLHGDELNLIVKGQNYGYPIVSEGDHYNNDPIPDHDTRPDFAAPKVAWTPTIAPGGTIYYTGSEFPEWQDSILVSGLASRALIRVEIDGEDASEAERIVFGNRLREVEQGPDGAVWVLEDRDGGRLLKLTAFED